MDLKELEAVIKLCRRTGVSTLSLEGISLTLTAVPPVSQYKKRQKKQEPSSFEKELAAATDIATKAKIRYNHEQMQKQAPNGASAMGMTDAPDELAMLMWSSGGGDGAAQ